MSIAALPFGDGADDADGLEQSSRHRVGPVLRDAAQKFEQGEELARRASVIAGRIAHLHADLVALAADVVAEGEATASYFGFRSAQQWLAVHTNLPPSQCRALVRLAERREELPHTMERLASGAISVDQAGAVAKHAPAWAEDDASYIAQGTTATQFARLMRRTSFELDPSDNPDLPEPKPDAPPQISLTTIDGRFHLKYQSDAVTGALVEKALREAKDALFTAGNAEATLADGMAEIASRSLAAVESPSRRDHYRIMLHLNTDGTGWVEKQGALPPALLRRVTCDGRVRPVWLTEGSPVNVGRSQRIVPERTRRLVEDRDQGCRFPGCTVQGGFVENHHITHWADGGRTDMEGLVSLCSFHHDAHHRGEFTISGTPARPDGLTFLNQYGMRIGREWEPEMLEENPAAGAHEEGVKAASAGSAGLNASAGGDAGPEGSPARSHAAWFPDGWEPDRSFPRGERLNYQWVSFTKPRSLVEAEERRASRWGVAGGEGDGKGVWEWLTKPAQPQRREQQERRENTGHAENDEPP